MWKTNLLWLLLLCLPAALPAQEHISLKFLKSEQDRDIWQGAEALRKKENYPAAAGLYKQLEEKYPGEQSLLFHTAVCLSYQSSTAEAALQRFEKTERKRFYASHFRLHYARALHQAYRFEEAITQLEEYLREKHSDAVTQTQANQLIASCRYATEALKNPVAMTIYPEKKLNGAYLTGTVPLLTPDETRLFFTVADSSGKKNMLLTSVKDSAHQWSEPTPLSPALAYQAVSLSPDAQTIYFSGQSETSDQQLFSNRMDMHGSKTPRKLYGNKLNSPWDETHISVSPDGRTAYFSSNRPGGYGGYDLYRSTLQSDGSWGDIQNLGPLVNSPGNEQTPFIHPSGTILLFSSDGHPGMGGYDFFRCDLQAEKSWSAPRNLGHPLNTPGDELHYLVSADGKTGYFSSTAQENTAAPLLYRAVPGLVENDVKLLRVHGEITCNDQPVQGQIHVNYKKSGELQGQYQAGADGRYFLYFSEGNSYTLSFSIAGYSAEMRELNFEDPERYYDIRIDIAFYSRDYLEQRRTQQAIVGHTEKAAPSLLPSATPTLTPEYALKKKEGLVYKIQIGAYSLPKDFNYNALRKLGTVEKQKLDDGVTRFTIGHFETLYEAYKFREEIIRAGIPDAFVTAEYQQKRFLVKEVLETGLLGE